MARARRSSGFTLVELSIATTVLGVIGLGLAGVTQLASSSLETNAALIEAVYASL